jgi:hypothetical protein
MLRKDMTHRGPAALGERWLAFVQIGWLALAISLTVLFGASLPAFYNYVLTCKDGPCFMMPPLAPGALERAGLSPTAYAAIHVTFELTTILIMCVVSALIIWRRRSELMALLAAFMLLTMGFGNVSRTIMITAEVYPEWYPVWAFLNVIALISLSLFVYLFPSRRFEPRWIIWIALPLTGLMIIGVLWPDSMLRISNWGPAFEGLAVICWFGSMLGAQIYRYRRLSDPVQRQQVKWVAFGIMGSTSMVISVVLLTLVLFPAQFEEGELWPMLILGLLVRSGFLLIPISIAIAILRYRLWDVDPILNRTLIYGILTALLVAIYLGGVMLLQTGFRSLTGQESELATMLSTLGVALLAAPLRRRIQETIDQRFYRRKYNAQKTLESFSAIARNEVELEKLTDKLLSTLEETMQPTHISIWLREPAQEGYPVARPPDTAN